MNTRLLSTLHKNSELLVTLNVSGMNFNVSKLSFRHENQILIVTSKDITENIVNDTKFAPVAELALSKSYGLRFSCRPSINYPELRSIEGLFLSSIESSLLCGNTGEHYESMV